MDIYIYLHKYFSNLSNILDATTCLSGYLFGNSQCFCNTLWCHECTLQTEIKLFHKSLRDAI